MGDLLSYCFLNAHHIYIHDKCFMFIFRTVSLFFVFDSFLFVESPEQEKGKQLYKLFAFFYIDV